MNWAGGFTTWLASVAGLEDIEELAESLDVPRCACAGDLECRLCDGYGVALELGVAG